MASSRKIALFAGGWLLAAGAIGTGVYLGSGALVAEVEDYSLVRLGVATPGAVPASVRGAAEAEATLRADAQRVAAAEVELLGRAGAAAGSARLADLGASIDVPETLARLGRAARRERVRVPLVGKLFDGEQPVVTVAPVIHVDMERLAQKVLELKDHVDVAPVSARIDLDAHRVVPEEMGHSLDVVALGSAVETAALAAFVASASPPSPPPAAAARPTLALPTVEIAPKITRASVEAIDISTVVSEFETHFSRGGEQARRGENIDRAASKLDGLVLPPDQIVSFNTVVGDRSEANGFKKSWEIFKGEMVEGIGGGTCQVASTIHAASFFGGLDVVERLPHSRPSAYITMGLDSTVVYPTVDLKLRNPYPFPVVVHTKTTASTLKVELLGKARPVTVKFSRELVKRLPFTRKLVEEPTLASNRVVHKQHGIDGYRIKRFREMTFADGTKKTEETTDFYPPTFDIFEVPVGFDESRLPTVPKDGEETVAAAPVAAPASASGPVSTALAGSVAHSAEGSTTAGAAGESELVIVDGKGAHAPNRSQLRPEARLRMGR